MKKMILSDWINSDYIPKENEMCIATDSLDIKFGDGSSLWMNLPSDINTSTTEEILSKIADALQEAKDYADSNDDNSIYDDSELRNKLTELETNLSTKIDESLQAAKDYADENERDTDTIYDDAELRDMISELDASVDGRDTEVLNAAKKYTDESLQFNYLQTSLDVGGTSIYNGTGWKKDVRIKSSGEEIYQYNCYLTGWIKAEKGDVIELKNIVSENANQPDGVEFTVYFASTPTTYEVAKKRSVGGTSILKFQYDETGNISQFTFALDGYSYFRIQCWGISEDSGIYINKTKVLSNLVQDVENITKKVVLVEPDNKSIEKVPPTDIYKTNSIDDKVHVSPDNYTPGSYTINRSIDLSELIDIQKLNDYEDTSIKIKCTNGNEYNKTIKIGIIRSGGPVQYTLDETNDYSYSISTEDYNNCAITFDQFIVIEQFAGGVSNRLTYNLYPTFEITQSNESKNERHVYNIQPQHLTEYRVINKHFTEITENELEYNGRWGLFTLLRDVRIDCSKLILNQEDLFESNINVFIPRTLNGCPVTIELTAGERYALKKAYDNSQLSDINLLKIESTGLIDSDNKIVLVATLKSFNN